MELTKVIAIVLKAIASDNTEKLWTLTTGECVYPRQPSVFKLGYHRYNWPNAKKANGAEAHGRSGSQ